eukprot:5625514-Prymnesium_polylepis.1
MMQRVGVRKGGLKIPHCERHTKNSGRKTRIQNASKMLEWKRTHLPTAMAKDPRIPTIPIGQESPSGAP